MFLCRPLLDVLVGRGIEDADSFIQPPSRTDLPDLGAVQGMTDAVDRLLAAMSQYVAIASVANCVPLQNGTRTLARLGMRARPYRELWPSGTAPAFLRRPRESQAGLCAWPDRTLHRLAVRASLDGQAKTTAPRASVSARPSRTHR